jgi:hypothetical protein
MVRPNDDISLPTDVVASATGTTGVVDVAAIIDDQW